MPVTFAILECGTIDRKTVLPTETKCKKKKTNKKTPKNLNLYSELSKFFLSCLHRKWHSRL